MFDEVKRVRESQNEPSSQGDLALVHACTRGVLVLVPVVCAVHKRDANAFPSSSSSLAKHHRSRIGRVFFEQAGPAVQYQ